MCHHTPDVVTLNRKALSVQEVKMDKHIVWSGELYHKTGERVG